MNTSILRMLLILLLLQDVRRPLYFDTFRLDMLLDRLHSAVNTLDSVNRLSHTDFSSLNLPAPEAPAVSESDISAAISQLGPIVNMIAGQKK